MKKGKTLNISLIPIVIVVAVAAIGFYIVNSNSDILNFDRGPKLRRLAGFPTTLVTDKQLEKKRLVIKNQDELNTFLNEIDDSGYLVVKESINFEKEYLLGIASSTYDEGGHTIKVKKVYLDKENPKLLVSVRETDSGETCEVELEKTVAVDLVAISKTDLEVEFERVKEVVECN